MQRLSLPLVLGVLASCLIGPLAAFAQSYPALDRTVLPFAEPKVAPITEIDARKAKAPPRFDVKAPKGAPNVVIALIDDIGC